MAIDETVIDLTAIEAVVFDETENDKTATATTPSSCRSTRMFLTTHGAYITLNHYNLLIL